MFSFFIFQFDRSSHRGKSDSIGGLEEVLSCLQPSEFEDEQLSRFKGLCWLEYVSLKNPEESDNFPDNLKFSLSTSPFSDSRNKNNRNNKTFSEISNKSNIGTNNNVNNEINTSPNANLPHQPPIVAVNDTALLLPNEQKENAIPDTAKRLEALGVENIKPSKRRHPLTIMRTMSERTLPLDKSRLFSLLTEKVNSSSNSDRTGFSLSSRHAVSESTSPTYKSLSSNNAKESSNIGESPHLDSVDKMLEAACDSMKSAQAKNEVKRREAVWDLFQSECAFLYDHLMVLKNVSIFLIL